MRPMRVGVLAAITGLALHVLAQPVAAAAAPPGDGTTASSAAGGVVVNEFVPSVQSWPVDEFVELRNTGEQVVELGGWELVACLSPTTWQVAARFPFGTEVPPDGYYLLTHASYTGVQPPDGHYDVEVPADGGWLLFDPWSGAFDGVGLGSGLDCTEGDPAPQCDWAAGEAVARDEQGTDTEDNSADFSCQPRTPGS